MAKPTLETINTKIDAIIALLEGGVTVNKVVTAPRVLRSKPSYS